MTASPRLIFVNLPVRDLPASMAFFRSLGFEFDERFTDETAACMKINELAYAMLIAESRFAEFAAKPVSDYRVTTGALLCVSADDRDGVDAFAEAALDAGAAVANEPTDYGFMYGRSFFDLDGHHWEVMWMSQEAIEEGPPHQVEPVA